MSPGKRMNEEFFGLLYANREFCEAMGRMTMASGRFESNLKAFLRLKGVTLPHQEATLGSLVSALKKHDLITENGTQVLRDLKRQRNYLTHSLFDLFAGRIDETVLPRTNLVPMDVDVFSEKARTLEENLHGLSRIVEDRLAQMRADSPTDPATGDRLFRP